MNNSKFIRKNLETLLDIYENEQYITDATKKLCRLKGIDYNDNIRKRASEIINEQSEKVVKLKEHGNLGAKILLFDIETAPMEALVFSRWQNNIGLHQIQKDWFVFCWSAKWLFEDGKISDCLTPEEALAQDDKRIVVKFWNLLNEADIIIAHNGKKFDEKKMNTRFFKHKLNPPNPTVMIDTLLHLRRRFALTSNQLDWVAHDFLGLEGKIKTDFTLWEECYRADKDALKRMSTYCDQDVHVLEELYLRMRAWIQPHPNLNLYINDNVSSCSHCLSQDLTEEGEYCTYATAYKAYRCNNCGAINRSRSALTTSEKKKIILYSIPTK